MIRTYRPLAPLIAIAMPWSAIAGDTRSGSGSSKTVDTPFFSLTLPGRWRQDRSEDRERWAFVRQDGEARLTVSGVTDPQRRRGPALEGLVRRLARIRREAEREVSQGATLLEPLVLAHDGPVVVARYMATEPHASRQVAALLIARPGLVLTFYLEMLDVSREQIEALGRPMFNSIAIK